MFAGVVAEQLPVEQMRQPRQRMPHVAIARRERPRDLRPTQAFVHLWIEADINGVVVEKKLEMLHRPVNGRDQADEAEADDPRTFGGTEHRRYVARLVRAYQFRSSANECG